MAFQMCYSALTSLFVAFTISAVVFCILGRSFLCFWTSLLVQCSVVLWNIMSEMPMYQRYYLPGL